MTGPLYRAAWSALDAALAAPVYADLAPTTAALPYAVVTTDTGSSDPFLADADGAATRATLTVSAYASTAPAARALGDAVEAALTDRAALGAPLAAEGLRLLYAGTDLHEPAPPEDPDRPVWGRVVRARYRLTTA